MSVGLPLQDRSAGVWHAHGGLWETELSSKREQGLLQDRNLHPRARGLTVSGHTED